MDIRCNIHVLLFVFFSVGVGAQKALEVQPFRSLGISDGIGISLFDNNYGLQLSYKYPLFGQKNITGIEMRVMDWGNQVSLVQGLEWKVIGSGPFALELSPKFIIGFPLYYNRFLIAYGLQTDVKARFEINRKWSLAASMGLRYDSNPAYRNIGFIHRTLEIPFGLSLQRKIGTVHSSID